MTDNSLLSQVQELACTWRRWLDDQPEPADDSGRTAGYIAGIEVCAMQLQDRVNRHLALTGQVNDA